MKLEGKVTILNRVGAIAYGIWGLMHIPAALSVYRLASTVPGGMVRARLMQAAWNLGFFAVTTILVAVPLWRNVRWAYWVNAFAAAVSDLGFIFFIAVPGYVPWWPALLAPSLWMIGWGVTTVAYLEGRPREEYASA